MFKNPWKKWCSLYNWLHPNSQEKQNNRWKAMQRGSMADAANLIDWYVSWIIYHNSPLEYLLDFSPEKKIWILNGANVRPLAVLSTLLCMFYSPSISCCYCSFSDSFGLNCLFFVAFLVNLWCVYAFYLFLSSKDIGEIVSSIVCRIEEQV